MTPTHSPDPAEPYLRAPRMLSLLIALWLVLIGASLFSPPVLDDADGTHANAARQMLLSGDWVTLHVNNVRYLEKAPLPYWVTAISFQLFGFNTFAAHLPEALSVLLLMLLGVRWTREAYGERAALYTGFGVLTSAGVFLFTRVFIPDVLLSLLLAAALYCFQRALAPAPDETVILSAAKNPRISPADAERPGALRLYPYAMWAALALAVLTKGLVAIVFVFGTAILFLALTGETRNWRRLKPITGTVLFLAIAAPWHILAGLRNTGGMNGHGFFWFYFINEHVLRFLGQRIPRDYNKLPGYLYWSLHFVWLFPWSLFVPLTLVSGWRLWRQRRNAFRRTIKIGRAKQPRPGNLYDLLYAVRYSRNMFTGAVQYATNTSAAQTTLLLALFSIVVLIFFSLSTNQEYYTFPAYLPLLMLLAAALARAEESSNLAADGFKIIADQSDLSADSFELTADSSQAANRQSNHAGKAQPATLTFAHAAFTVLGVLISAALAYGLWTSRHLAALPNVGDLLAHRGIGDYTLSMSSLFDLTGPSFAALRLPASIALAAFAFGPALAWILRVKRHHLAATTTIALTSALFLVAAHIALARFAPMLSSEDMAAKIQQLESSGAISRDNILLLYGDQAYGSSIPFYLNRPLNRPALLVDGRSSSMLFGSTFPDAQGLFLTPAQLVAEWGTGTRKLLFVPILHRDDFDRLLGPRAILIEETAGKALFTDRPLDH